MVNQENVFVLGLDERNLALLHDLPHLREYRFHALLHKDELMTGEVDLTELLAKAQSRIDAFDGTVDAIVGYWDFPVSSMVPLLARRNDLPGPSLESVIKCEHKYWSRLQQREATAAYMPFALVELDNADQPDRPPDDVRFPMWIKPVKSYSSVLAFKVNDADEFAAALTSIRGGIAQVGKAFDELLSMIDLPPEIANTGGQACLAEEEVSGVQLTTEGYCFQGEPHVYGVVDSLCYAGTSCFLRYQYPSTRVPQDIIDRATNISESVVRRIGLDDCTFNIEFFWDEQRGRINILEINPRLSQSHAPLFEFVDGVPNHQCMVRLALGRDPGLPSRRGEHAIAGKWFLRHFTDARVVRSPSEQDIARVRDEMPGTIIDIVATQGSRLSELPAQDSYSYELASVYLGARDETDLRAKYDRCVELLPFVLDEEAP